MTSLATVAAGRLMLSDVALPALPLLALVAPRNPMLVAPGQVSATSHSFAAARHTTPAFPAGCVHAALVPLHTSVVQGSPSSVQAVPLGWKASVGQVVLVPVQVSATSHSPAAARHTAPAFPAGCVQVLVLPSHRSRVQGLVSAVHAVPAGCFASAGHVALVPVQLSATSHSPAAARHTAPAFPAGCVHVALVPSHTSRVHTLPSSVQVVPLAFRVSAGQAVVPPSQVSARSHSPAAARQTAPASWMASAGQAVLVPVQVSAMSHPPTAARQTVPAFPAACVHAGAPTVPLHTSAVHTLPSSVQLVPAAFTVSGGQLALWGASAMSWPMLAVFPVDAFAPLAPAAACATSALSEAALVELDVSAWNRPVMPVGAPLAERPARPKQATSMVLATVVVIDGVELLTCPPDALMGLVVSTLS